MGIIQKSLDTARKIAQKDVLEDYAAMLEGWQPRCLSEARDLAKRLRLYLPSAARKAGIEINETRLDEVCRLLEGGDYLLFGFEYADAVEELTALPEGA